MTRMRPIASAGLCALLGLAAFVLSASSPQCARSDDRVLNPPRSLSLQGEDLVDCVQGCNDDAAALRAAENERHKAAMAGCGEDTDCLGEAGRYHALQMQKIAEAMQLCKAGCHEQGEGTGGQ